MEHHKQLPCLYTGLRDCPPFPIRKEDRQRPERSLLDPQAAGYQTPRPREESNFSVFL